MPKDIRYLLKTRRNQIIYRDIHNNSHSNTVVKTVNISTNSNNISYTCNMSLKNVN